MASGAAARRYRVVANPRRRQPVLDVLAAAARQYTIHGLIEVDVTAARERLALPGQQVSFTAFVVATVARAVAEHPQVNARRTGRRLLLFDDVDVVVTIERPLDETPTPMPTVLLHDEGVALTRGIRRGLPYAHRLQLAMASPPCLVEAQGSHTDGGPAAIRVRSSSTVHAPT